jgi:hypothetical protein
MVHDLYTMRNITIQEAAPYPAMRTVDRTNSNSAIKIACPVNGMGWNMYCRNKEKNHYNYGKENQRVTHNKHPSPSLPPHDNRTHQATQQQAKPKLAVGIEYKRRNHTYKYTPQRTAKCNDDIIARQVDRYRPERIKGRVTDHTCREQCQREGNYGGQNSKRWSIFDYQDSHERGNQQ